MILEASWAFRVAQSLSKVFIKWDMLSSRKITTKKRHPRKTKMKKRMSCQVNLTTRNTSKKLGRVNLGISSFGVKGEMIWEANLNNIICNTPKITKALGTKCNSSKIPNTTKPSNQTPLLIRSTWKIWRDNKKASKSFQTSANNTAKTLTTPSSLEETKIRTSLRWWSSSQTSALISILCMWSRKWLKRVTSLWFLMTLIRLSWVKSDTPKSRARNLLTRLATSIRLRVRGRFRRPWSNPFVPTQCTTNIAKST